MVDHVQTPASTREPLRWGSSSMTRASVPVPDHEEKDSSIGITAGRKLGAALVRTLSPQGYAQMTASSRVTGAKDGHFILDIVVNRLPDAACS